MTEQERQAAVEEEKVQKTHHKQIYDKYPISKNDYSRILSIAGLHVFTSKDGPTVDDHLAYYTLLNSLHLLVFDVQKQIKDKICEHCRCRVDHQKGCQCWNDE